MTAAGAKQVLAIVPARGGSQRFPRKNVAPLGGKPLLAWTVEAALASGVCSRVVVSSDNEEILHVGRAAGAVSVRRAAELATATATTAAVCAAYVRELDARGDRPDAVYVLLPTSPLRSAESIRRAWEFFAARNADALMSVQPLAHPPEWALAVEDGWVALADPAHYETPRTQLPLRFRADGAHTIVRAAHLLATGRFVGPRTLAFVSPAEEAVDIDEPGDLAFAEFLLSRRRSGA